MSAEIVEHVFTGTTTTVYDPTKTTVGSLMVQNTGTTAKEKWVGPRPIAYTQVIDTHYGSYFARPYVIDGDNNCDWIFNGYSLATTASLASPRLGFFEYNRTTNTFRFLGVLSFTMPYVGTIGIFPMPNISVSRHLYTTGTVEVSGVNVTGSGSGWQSARIAAGARIGFGSTNPNEITNWQEISAIVNDTSITLMGSPGTIEAETPYVIDELRICLCCINNTTATNAGLYVVKGLHYGCFTTVMTVIPAAVATDNVRAVYWLAESETTAMRGGFAIPQLDPVSNTDHTAYFLNANTTTTITIHAFNIRAALTLSEGRTTSAYLFSTATSLALPQAVTLFNNAHKFITCNHGPAAGIPSLYVYGVSRIYRIPLNQIYSGNSGFFAEGYQEIPTGSAGTMIATAGFYTIDYLDDADRFIIGPSASAVRGYITKHLTNGNPHENCWGISFSQYDRAATLPEFTPTPTMYNSAVRYNRGTIFFIRIGASATPSVIYAIPFVHWDYTATNGQKIITPALDTPRLRSLTRAYTNATTFLGSDAYGNPTDPYRLSARISGISDDSGEWTLIDDTGDLSVFNPSDARYADPPPTQIQFMIEFKTPYWTNIPARIHSVVCVYEKFSTDAHFRPSPIHTVPSNSVFAWKFVEAFGSSVPALRVLLMDESTDHAWVDDDTNKQWGLFEKSIDNGKNWLAWDNSDKDNDQTYFRYTPAALPENKKLRMVLTLR